MKTIHYAGFDYKVPDWVNYVRKDKDGTVYGYEISPNFYVNLGEWLEGGNVYYLGIWEFDPA